jgi:hypothetical protein
MADICESCQREVHGSFEVTEEERADGFVIKVEGTPDRDFNVCDACNKLVCFDCCCCPERGYCSDCCIKYYK